MLGVVGEEGMDRDKFASLRFFYSLPGMKQWSLALHGKSRLIGTYDTGGADFVVGSEVAADVWHVDAQGCAARHARICIDGESMRVEDLGSGSGTRANGCAVSMSIAPAPAA